LTLVAILALLNSKLTHCACLILCVGYAMAKDARQTVYISSMITQAERTPAFTANAEYQVTGVNYDEGPSRIMTTGERSLASRGAQFRNDYIDR